jgi:TRAP-type C4-dicarboxylate transport system permease large subunit
MLFGVLAAFVGLLIAGFGVPVTKLVEGLFGYFDAILYAIVGTALVGILYGNGTLKWILSRIAKVKSGLVKSLLLVLFIALPGMISGMATVSLLTAGTLAGTYLIENGMSKKKAVAFAALGAIIGMLLPPYSMLVMIFMSNTIAGASLPLLVLGLPLFVATAIVFTKPVTKVESAEGAEAAAVPGGFTCFIPLIVVLALYLWYDFLKAVLPFLGLPLIALIGCVLAVIFPAGKRTNPITDAGELIAKVSPLLAAVAIAGFVQATVARCGVTGALSSIAFQMGGAPLTTIIGFVVTAVIGIFAGWFPALTVGSIAMRFGGSSFSANLAYAALLAVVMLFTFKNNLFDQTAALLTPEEPHESSWQNLKGAMIPALVLIAMMIVYLFATSAITSLRV